MKNFNNKLKYLLNESSGKRDYIKELLIREYLEKRLEDEEFLEEVFEEVIDVNPAFSEERLINLIYEKFGKNFNFDVISFSNLVLDGNFDLPNFEDFVEVLVKEHKDKFKMPEEIKEKILEKFRNKEEIFWKKIIDDAYAEGKRNKLMNFEKSFFDFYGFYRRLRRFFDIWADLEIKLKFVNKKIGKFYFDIEQSVIFLRYEPYIYDEECLIDEFFEVIKNENTRKAFLSDFGPFLFENDYFYYEKFPGKHTLGGVENWFTAYVKERLSTDKKYEKCIKISEKLLNFWKNFLEIIEDLRKKLNDPYFLVYFILSDDKKEKKVIEMLEKIEKEIIHENEKKF